MASTNFQNHQEPSAARISGRLSNRHGIFLLTLLALLALLAMQRGVSRAMKMKVEAAHSTEIAQLEPGETAEVMLELIGVHAGSSAKGRLLEKQSETICRRGAGTVQFEFSVCTPIVMGQAIDLHQGSVVHVTGTVGDDRSVLASQIVILTGYIRVE